MPRLSSLVALLSLVGAAFVSATPEFNQEEDLRNSKCDNGCWFSSFPGGSCTDDAACMCTQQKYREAYFCCMAKNCAADVAPESIIRQHNDCWVRGMDFTFDSEAVCGLKLAFPTTAMPGEQLSSTSSAASSTASSGAKETTSAAVTTSAVQKTNGTATVSVTTSPTQSAPAQNTDNSAPGNMGVEKGLMGLLLGAGVMLL